MRHEANYVGRHRKEDSPTIPLRVIRFINERYRVHHDPEFLFTHQHELLHNKKGKQ